MKALIGIIAFALIWLSGNALAFDFEKLFLPGEVIAGHFKYEEDCKQCHVRARETTQRQLCLDCHERIASDVNKAEGFHGKDKMASKVECKECHTDHKGRKATIVWLDKDRFDHRNTDYPLLGRHRETACSGCHEAAKHYYEAPGKCIDCHRDDDAHNEEQGDQCENCHNEKSWSSEQFDHDKTDFKLKGAHDEVACDLCHVGDKYKDTPKQCISCHGIKNVHGERFGDKCGDCHQETGWDKSKFDHDRDTKYRLRGAHEKIRCHACHNASYRVKGDQRKSRNCYACHKLDDSHAGKNGKKCDDCHQTSSWLQTEFDHDKKTEFPLRGKHKEASCQACHQAGTEQDMKLDKDCYSCHKHEDAHKEQQGKECETCHNESSWWLEDVRYDHDLTRFPLIGQHAVIGCEACHQTSAFQDAGETCNDCHQHDDVHEQSLSTKCDRCHNPNDWLIWSFDHDETDFKLVGAHEDLHCKHCHREPMLDDRRKLVECHVCHRRDDIHQGNFGLRCNDCHNQEKFSEVEMNDVYRSTR